MSAIIFREVTPHSESVEQWNEVTINAGASQSTLQDIKLPDCAGSYSYLTSGDPSSICSNRFIYWRTSHDVIELVEVSLDVTLQHNHLRLRFQNTPILRGISLQEYKESVVLLVPTVSAIHKLVFPHPKLLKSAFRSSGHEQGMQSVFSGTSFDALRGRSCFFVLNNVSLGSPVPHTACSWLNVDGNATFILANNAGSVLMVVMSEKNGVEITTSELMRTGTLFRLISSIRSTKVEMALSIVCHRTETDVLVFALFSDLQIRVFSSKKQDCILVDSVLNYSEKKSMGGILNTSLSQCHLRKSEADDKGDFYLGIYIPLPQQKIIYIFSPNLASDQCKLCLSSTLYHDTLDLVDFSISSNHVWSLWLNFHNQASVLTAFLDGDWESKQQPSWVPVNLESKFSRIVDGGSNPQSVYLNEIFKVGRFLPSTIAKAINIYKTNKNMSFSSNVALKLENLKNRVIEAVESEILMKTGIKDNSAEKYVKLSKECWGRFYSYCMQYHDVGMKPLGISSDPNTGCVIIVKKNFYSLVSPCDPLEIITTPHLRSSSFLLGVLDNSEMKLYHGLKAVLACVDVVRKSIDEKQLMAFEEELFKLSSPTNYASKLCELLDLKSESDFYRSLKSTMPSNSEVVACLEYLITKFDLSVEEKEIDDSLKKYSNFGSSSSGVGALCAGLANFARQRFEFCRDMLLFEMVLLHSDCVEYEQLYNFLTHSAIIPKTAKLLRSYYIILWCTQCECVPVPPSIQDAAFKQFCLLEVPEFTNEDLTRMKVRQTISHLFFQENGGIRARKIMEMNSSSATLADWENLFPNLIVGAATLLWPLVDNVLFPEFLFSRCQHFPLQEYDRLLQEWCIENKQFLNFLVACSYLILGESWKATNIFLDVSKEIKIDSLLCEKVMKGRYGQESSVTGAFYMRVIQLFEQFNISDCIVKLATAALNELEENDTHAPIFYSVLFKHHLNLGHSEEAFATLIKNPDSSRRKDCLRQLVVKLCESKQFQKIIELSYLAYEEEVISILESRARCSDLCHTTSFYRILYSLHIHHKKFRKAASVMYELALRFSREVLSLKGLRKQASCYLAVINCLHLAEPEYAWLVKPTLTQNTESLNQSKRNSDGDEIFHTSRPVKVEVLCLEDIKKEYILVQSRLLHAQKLCNMPNIAAPHLTPEETVALLLKDGLFEAAIHLSSSFSLSLIPVFESLAYRCLGSSLLSTAPITTDDLDSSRYLKYSGGSYDIGRQSRSQMWNVLKKYLDDHEAPDQSELHRCVTDKLLTHGSALPAWLKLSYQKRNFTELVSLYISHGLLEESITLVHKYIKAVLGIRKEDFNLMFSLQVNTPSVWLPHTYIDILLDAACELPHDDNIKELYQEFSKTLNEYYKAVESVTMSKIKNALCD